MPATLKVHFLLVFLSRSDMLYGMAINEILV